MNTVFFRDFEEKDIDAVYHWKNDEKLNSMIVGQWHPFSYEDAKKWVQGCMGEHDTYKFWAICTNDEERRIIGWVSLSNIDFVNNSACHHGLVIGDKSYRDGSAMFEAMLCSMDYAFSNLKLHRLYGSCLSEHKTTPHLLKALGFTKEGNHRDAFYKDNQYYDVLDYSILDKEYFHNIDSGAYNMSILIHRFIKSVKQR